MVKGNGLVLSVILIILRAYWKNLLGPWMLWKTANLKRRFRRLSNYFYGPVTV